MTEDEPQLISLIEDDLKLKESDNFIKSTLLMVLINLSLFLKPNASVSQIRFMLTNCGKQTSVEIYQNMAEYKNQLVLGKGVSTNLSDTDEAKTKEQKKPST